MDNDRIQELMDECWDYGRGIVNPRKLAYKIIKECCDMVNKHHQYNNPNDCLLVLDIKEHFGVE